MAIVIIGQEKTHPYTKITPIKTHYMGITTDTKPIDCEAGSTIKVFTEATKLIESEWLFNGETWYKTYPLS
jgi:hypothetical protein